MTENQISVALENVNFSKFKLKRILNNNSNRKMICCIGHFEDVSNKDLALIILEKKSFTEENVKCEETGIFSNKSSFKKEFINDIYGNFECLPIPDINCNILCG